MMPAAPDLPAIGDFPAGDDAALRKNLMLLVQLRWIAVGGQVATMTVARSVLGVALPLPPMAAVLAALVLLNLGSLARLRRPVAVTPSELFTALLVDVASLTAQLYLTGGATNPFAFLYLLQITLGAVLLDARSTWIVVALGASCFAGLIAVHKPLVLPPSSGLDLFSLHVYGMWICFALDAALLVSFVVRINRNLRERDARLADLRQRAVEEDHIVRMGLLASGAAHELGTPLSTLSVILGDWRRLPALAADRELMDEVDAMEAQLGRCKQIVTRILLSAGQARGESARVTGVRAFLGEVVADWRAARASATLQFDDRSDDDLFIVADTSLKQMIFNVLDNAAEASPGWVGFSASCRSGTLVLEIADDGPGFAPDMLEQIGRPYRSSKGRRGHGIGLFLVVNVLRKLGGTFEVRNRAPGGAVVTLALPLAALSIGNGGRADAA